MHLSLIGEADLLIASGRSSLAEIEAAIDNSFQVLVEAYDKYSDNQLAEELESYWGTRYEWLLEIVAHIYHHRGQLHAMLVHAYRKDPQIALFE